MTLQPLGPRLESRQDPCDPLFPTQEEGEARTKEHHVTPYSLHNLHDPRFQGR